MVEQRRRWDAKRGTNLDRRGYHHRATVVQYAIQDLLRYFRLLAKIVLVFCDEFCQSLSIEINHLCPAVSIFFRRYYAEMRKPDDLFIT